MNNLSKQRAIIWTNVLYITEIVTAKCIWETLLAGATAEQIWADFTV